jgi:hypothetical protein
MQPLVDLAFCPRRQGIFAYWSGTSLLISMLRLMDRRFLADLTRFPGLKRSAPIGLVFGTPATACLVSFREIIPFMCGTMFVPV